ncbi:toxic anion resistance protein, partial [Amycolatopsis sp. CA-126428]|uniref:toxic anion resistance protein n=1 Tax=Amycolatopsis sp. CA-126428 TaxID=2073158 RepID=UPI001E568FA5
VSGALASQRDVLDEVAALQATTDGLIRANTELLDLQSAEIRRASSDPAAATETIRQSFDRIYASIDAIDGFRADAVRALLRASPPVRGRSSCGTSRGACRG